MASQENDGDKVRRGRFGSSYETREVIPGTGNNRAKRQEGHIPFTENDEIRNGGVKPRNSKSAHVVRDHGNMLDALHLITKLIGLFILLWVSLFKVPFFP
jgi:hypothetical protein